MLYSKGEGEGRETERGREREKGGGDDIYRRELQSLRCLSHEDDV